MSAHVAWADALTVGAATTADAVEGCDWAVWVDPMLIAGVSVITGTVGEAKTVPVAEFPEPACTDGAGAWPALAAPRMPRPMAAAPPIVAAASLARCTFTVLPFLQKSLNRLYVT